MYGTFQRGRVLILTQPRWNVFLGLSSYMLTSVSQARFLTV